MGTLSRQTHARWSHLPEFRTSLALSFCRNTNKNLANSAENPGRNKNLKSKNRKDVGNRYDTNLAEIRLTGLNPAGAICTTRKIVRLDGSGQVCVCGGLTVCVWRFDGIDSTWQPSEQTRTPAALSCGHHVEPGVFILTRRVAVCARACRSASQIQSFWHIFRQSSDRT